ncbi:carboxypeptidase regulatory-like domain-containing protein [Nocardioides islandensis]|uniref:Carboxypeptidase regulatory-like domain-containing protein n=1 Tax=Nocardioides islandensis TaxID=433663 RepID=A0A930VG99_9ACTN|nr:carboxypeptidase-like regulatory domain-containing protein [Nocardioides islandensis]MBF4764240.1 carboxypeptidase regulatory-like domain-containing protein [Nocardioides islandensis]
MHRWLARPPGALALVVGGLLTMGTVGGTSSAIAVADDAVVGGAAAAAPGHIIGTVTDSGGQPLAGVMVGVWTLPPPGQGASVYSKLTDATGGYDIFMNDGTYRVSFDDPSGAYATEYYDNKLDMETSDPVAASSAGATTGIDASLAPAAVLSGRLTHPDGTPVTKGMVVVYRLVGGAYKWRANAYLDGTGAYRAAGLQAGTYRLGFHDAIWQVDEYWNDAGTLESAAPIAVAVGQQVSGLDAVLDPAQGPLAIRNVLPPDILGRPRVGEELTATPGSWVPAGVSVTYQWQSKGVAIPGATGSTFRPTAADIGRTIRVRVTASQPGYWIGYAQSESTAMVKPGVIHNSESPRIRGVLRVGQKIKVTSGQWQPQQVKLHYQWFAGHTKIRGATKRTLVIGSQLVGQRLSVRVKASASGYEPLRVRTRRSAEVER